MRRTSDVLRVLWGALALLCALATASGSAHDSVAGQARSAWSAFAAARVESPFRLGTAAQPFAWSTAVGDLNADGSLDYAVADRIGRGAGGFEYAVQLSISGLASQRVTFNSPDAALSISLRDVDHDQDLDVVVSTIVSPDVVRVWLNDGRGGFAETATRDDSIAWRDGPALETDRNSDTVACVESPAGGSDALLAPLERSSQIAEPSLLSAGDGARLSSALGSRLGSRAPPSAAPLVL